MKNKEINNKPVYTISSAIVDWVARIAERVGELKNVDRNNQDLHLRKANRLRSIHSSLAIENNTLTLGQVIDIINGKRVLGPPDEIEEVKNAYRSYEHLTDYDPYKVRDFLKAHQLMTQGLVSDAGKFRSTGVGVFDGSNLVHLGASYQFVPQLVDDLLLWAKQTDIHPLIKSSVVHFEIELIHPFMDGNGRMGRLWQTLILSKWQPLFAWLPIETMVYENQQGYYDALQVSQKSTDSQRFIEFMLEAIWKTLNEFNEVEIPDIFPDINTDMFSITEIDFLAVIAGYLSKNETITNQKARSLTGKSADSVKKYMSKFVQAGLLLTEGDNKGRKYKLNKKQKCL